MLAFLRQYEDETILVVVNLSRFAQPAELDLSRFDGSALMEVFSQNYFPPIKRTPYPITLGPHAHYWFLLRPQTAAARASDKRVVPTIRIEPNIATLIANEQRALFEREILPDYIRGCRWFGGKARTIRAVQITEEIPISSEANSARVWFLEVSYLEGATESYALARQDHVWRRCEPHLAQCAACGHCAVQSRRAFHFARRRLGQSISGRTFSHTGNATVFAGKAWRSLRHRLRKLAERGKLRPRVTGA